jgi:1-acyl-sn-glycerol-3-phosphate acyltransferase
MKERTTWMYRLSVPIIYVIFRSIWRPKVIGVENIPKDTGVVLAGTHTHILDAWMLPTTVPRTVHFLAKKELWSGLKGLYFGSMGMIPVDRSKHDHNSLEKAVEYLKDGCAVVVFPEGTLERGKGLMEFKIGAVKMAQEANVQVVPFAVCGKYKAFRKSVTIKYGKPISISKRKDLTKDNERLREKVKELLEEE